MNTYRFVAWPTFRFPSYVLTADSLTGTIARAELKQLIALDQSSYEVHLQVDRANHQDARQRFRELHLQQHL